MLDTKIELIRRRMQDQLDAQHDAIEIWRAESPQEREFIIPQPWELTAFLTRRLRLTKLALKIAVSCIRDLNRVSTSPSVEIEDKATRLERAL